MSSFVFFLWLAVVASTPPPPAPPAPPDDRVCFTRAQVAELRLVMDDARERLVAERRGCEARIARVHTDHQLEVARHAADLAECRDQRAALLARKCGTCWLPWLLVGVGLAGGIGIGIAIGYGAKR